MIAESRASALSRTTPYVSFEIILAAFPFLGFTKQNNKITINRDTRTPHHIRKDPLWLGKNSFWFPCGDLKSRYERQEQRSLDVLKLGMPLFQLPGSDNQWAKIRTQVLIKNLHRAPLSLHLDTLQRQPFVWPCRWWWEDENGARRIMHTLLGPHISNRDRKRVWWFVQWSMTGPRPLALSTQLSSDAIYDVPCQIGRVPFACNFIFSVPMTYRRAWTRV